MDRVCEGTRRCWVTSRGLVVAWVTAFGATSTLFRQHTKTQFRAFCSPLERALANTHMHLNLSPMEPLAPHLSPITSIPEGKVPGP